MRALTGKLPAIEAKMGRKKSRRSRFFVSLRVKHECCSREMPVHEVLSVWIAGCAKAKEDIMVMISLMSAHRRMKWARARERERITCIRAHQLSQALHRQQVVFRSGGVDDPLLDNAAAAKPLQPCEPTQGP